MSYASKIANEESIKIFIIHKSCSSVNPIVRVSGLVLKNNILSLDYYY